MDLATFDVTLEDGRKLSVDSPAFAERLPITKGVVDRLRSTDDLHEALGAVVTAILQLEARGVDFEDAEFTAGAE